MQPEYEHWWMRTGGPPPRGTIVVLRQVDDVGHRAWRLETLEGEATGSGLLAGRAEARTYAEQRGWHVQETIDG